MPGPGAPGRGRGPTPDAVLALPEPARRMTALPVTSSTPPSPGCCCWRSPCW
ncbi:hypothetical protein [Teichococcus aestuarii]|uniref:hypothetical protein n=1 Tax=Teichococcus aestuarii TaxID=568898 RepID=UPI003613F2F4